jgi:two-component system, LuxR family, response regulator FixJ
LANLTPAIPTVRIVDDDQSIRRAMELLMKSVGLPCRIYQSANSIIDDYSPEWRGCLVLDIRMPGMSGLELRERLSTLGSTLPVIFITGYGDIPMAIEAIRNGAFDFIEKPFRDQELLERIAAAMQADDQSRQERTAAKKISDRLSRLTPREREVFDLVVQGKANKLIAHELGVSQRTVEIHRARVMTKMEARSLAELVRMHLES